MSAAAAPREKHWFPLESNPDVMNPYLQKLGFPTAAYRFTDVMSTEDWALECLPSPVIALVMLFPIKEESEKHRMEEAARLAEAGQTVSPRVYFMKQVVGNACGTIGIIHCVANLSTHTGGSVELEPGSFFDKFVTDTLGATPDVRAVALEANDEIEEAHESAAQEGVGAVVEDVNSHFVAFIAKDGCVYELDGRKDFPINHGPTTPETFLTDACAVIRGFMARDPEEMRFTITALAAPAEE